MGRDCRAAERVREAGPLADVEHVSRERIFFGRVEVDVRLDVIGAARCTVGVFESLATKGTKITKGCPETSFVILVAFVAAPS
jgi:hypothetical protein